MKTEEEIKYIYRITLSLSKNGFKWNSSKWNCEEKKLIHKLTRISDGEIQTKHVKNDELYNITTIVNNSINYITYSKYTLEENIEETKSELLNRVIGTAQAYKSELESLFLHINNLKQ